MLSKPSSLAVAFAVLILSGCASTDTESPFPEPRPLGRGLPVSRAEPTEGPPEAREPAGSLTLRGALAAALAMNPRLASFSWEVRALDAEALQAGLLPNPELEGELEDFGGTGGFAGTRDAEATLRVSQLLELGGKRRKREAVATLTRDLAGWEYESVRLRVFTETTQAFIEVVAAQRRVSLAEEAHRLAQETLDAVSERVDAGKVSPLEKERARVLASSSRIALDRARRELVIARRNLAVRWGSDTPRFERAEGELEETSPVPALSELAGHLDRNPDVARWDTEQGIRRAELALAEAGAVPDLTGQVGIKRFLGPDETAFLVGVGVELPIFDRNQGSILAARRRIFKVREERRAAETEILAALKVAHERLSGALLESNSLRDEVLPAAERTFAAAQEAYQQGKAGYLEVLDAQNAFVGARSDYLDALESYHRNRAEVERLIAGPLDDAAAPGGGE